MRDRPAYTALIEDLLVAMDHVRGQYDSKRAMWRRLAQGEGASPEPLDPDVIALAYTIHNLYNAMENYFLRVAKFFENHLEAATWHRDLVNRMAVEIEDLRPSLLSRESLRDFHELRGFRHVFRSLYDTPLDPEKVALVHRRVQPAFDALAEAL